MKLHDYQHVAVEFLRARGRAGLFIDMGLGKTAVCLTALEPRHLPALVVAPKRVAENVWQEERDLWRPDLSIGIAMGTPQQRAAVLDAGHDITVIGRDNIKDIVGRDHFYRTLIIDELSGFKDQSSARFKTMRRWTPKYVWGLTGTPVPNGLLDLWPQMFLLDRGARLGKTVSAYRSRYFLVANTLPTGVVIEWALRPEAEAAIHRKIDDIALSMETEGRVEVPELRFNQVDVPMLPTIRRAYRDFKRDLLVNLQDLGLGEETHTAANNAIIGNKLQQISSGALYSDSLERTYTVLHHEKIRACREIVDGTGSPTLIFYRYQFELDMLRGEFKGQLFTPATPNLQREWNAGNIPILAAHPASIGHGLNLQKGPGRTIIWATPTWSLEEWQQGNKRLARQGSQHPWVMVHMLVSPKTVDGLVYRALLEKDMEQLRLLEHLESPL